MKTSRTVLITGGTGYIGSHTAVSLIEHGYEVVIVDNLSNSDVSTVDRIAEITGKKPVFYEADLTDLQALRRILTIHKDTAAVIHFAALKAVGESVEKPLEYYFNNFLSLLNLLKAMKEMKINNLVFSSSATVYGEPDQLPLTESSPTKPATSPYGNTKKVGEEMIRDVCKVHPDFNAISLRYFNPIGAHSSAKIGELPNGVPNNLMPFITQTAAGLRKELLVFGDDYNTPDGTAIRDYIHVVDLAEAHVSAVRRMLNKEQADNYEVFNLGTGKGSSVFEVIRSFERASHLILNYRIVGKRDGDVPETFASTVLANAVLKWKAKFDLDQMTASAWAWEQNLKNQKQDFPTVVVRAPGRINIIGEHTDYNDGFVLPAAIDKYITVKLRRNGTRMVNIVDQKLEKAFSFDLASYAPLEKGWPNYIMGIVHELQLLGGDIKGFDAEFESTVPIGGGMSSSAALECGFAVGLNELFDIGLSKWQLIKAAMMAEHNFVGIKCGIMDQFASMLGRENHVMLLDCRTLDYEYFPFDLGEYQIIILNTNVSHALATSEYNTRRRECEEGVTLLQNFYPGIKKLRDIDLSQLEKCRGNLPEHIFRRCRHVVEENQRVLNASNALAKGDIKRLGHLMYQSHNSLQHDFEVSCPELDFLVEQSKGKEFIVGSRMMGGGFGGCTISILKKSMVEEWTDQISTAYRTRFGIELTLLEVSIGNGTTILSFNGKDHFHLENK